MSLLATLNYQAGYNLSRLLSQSQAYRLADALSLCSHHFKKSEREQVQKNIAIASQNKRSAQEIQELARQTYLNFGANIVNYLYDSRDPQFKTHLKNLTVHQPQHLQQSLSLKKGLILASIHGGNWEMGSFLFANTFGPLHVLASSQLLGKHIYDHYRLWRKGRGVETIDLDHQKASILHVLKKQGTIGILCDRIYNNQYIEGDIFNKPAKLPKGPIALSLLTSSPMLFIWCDKIQSSYHLHFFPPLVPPPSQDATDTAKFTRLYFDRIGELIQMDLSRWYCFPRIWI